MMRETRRFSTWTDDGSEVTLVELAKVIAMETQHDSMETLSKWREYRTANGENVNCRSEGVYQVVKTGLILRESRTSPLIT